MGRGGVLLGGARAGRACVDGVTISSMCRRPRCFPLMLLILVSVVCSVWVSVTVFWI